MTEESNAAVTTETVKDAVEENFTEETPKKTDVTKEEDEEETDLKQAEKSVRLSHFQRSDIHSPYTRFGYPCFLLFTLGLLIASEVSNGIVMKSYSDYHYVDPFTMENVTETECDPSARLNMYILTKDLWLEGAYAMSIMTCIFSVVWPFLKLISLFTFWFYPFDAKHPKKRYMEYCIEMAEQAGKWSLLEVYMLIIYIVIFSYTSTAEGMSTENIIYMGGVPVMTLDDFPVKSVIVVFMDVLWGMSGFIMASCLALMASHYVLHKHRAVIYTDVINTDEKVSFVQKEGKNVFLFAGFLILTTMLVVTGFLFKTVHVDYIKSSETNNTYPYKDPGEDPELGPFEHEYTLVMDPVYTYDHLDSAATYGINFSVVSERPSSFATKFVQFVFFNMAVAFPVVNHIALLLFCILPLKREMREFLYTIAVSSSAWCGYGVNLCALLMVMIDTKKINDSINKDCQTLCNNLDISFTGYSALFFCGYGFHIVANFYVSWYGHKHLYGSKA